MYLDIDHFKAINDTLGHQGGDEVLREFSRRLTDSVQPVDTVARLAGDEFVIIIEGSEMPGDATVVARKIIDAMQEEIPVLDSLRRVSASIGIAVLREGENDAGALLRRADEALYMAKSAGRNTFKCIS
jgi:diguanylate cyclase (GGDEF)-like protein